MAHKRYRVAQWATGNVGLRSLQAIIEHPQFDLVGVKVYSEAKIGRDAGDLCGLPPTGIIATGSIEDIIAARPDCVVYMADRPEYDVMCRLLGEGINIATALTCFNHRDSLAPDIRARLEAACARGGSSLYASGSTPGYSTETLLFALTSIMRRIDRITQTEMADMSSRNSPEMLFDFLGFGRDPKEVAKSTTISPTTGLAPSLRMTAAALSLPLDEVTYSCEYATARNPVTIAAGRIEAGTVGAMRMEITGVRDGKPLIIRRAVWYVTRDLDPPWDIPEVIPAWHYLIEGDMPLNISITYAVTEEEYPRMTPGLTANPVINAVPYVCDGPPGILQTDELPSTAGNFSRGG